MLGLSVIILFKSLLHVFCSLVFSAHNSSEGLAGKPLSEKLPMSSTVHYVILDTAVEHRIYIQEGMS